MEGVVNVDVEVDIAVATIYCSVGVDNQRIGEVGPVRRVVDDVVAIHERSIATNYDVCVAVEGVVDVQSDNDVTVAVSHGLMQVDHSSVVQQHICRTVTDKSIAIHVGIVATDGVVTRSAEGVVDVQTYLDCAVAAADCAVHSYNGGIVEVGAMRYVANHIAVVASVVEVSVAADGVVTDSAEGVVDVQTYLDCAVAAAECAVHSYNGGIIEVGAMRYVTYSIAIVASVVVVSVAADGVVTDSAESVVDVQTDLDSAVAAANGLVHCEYNCIVEIGTMRYVVNRIAVVARVDEVSVAADGVVTDSAEGVVDVQTYLDCTVATTDSTVHCEYGSIVKACTVRDVTDNIAVVAIVIEVCVAADGVVANSTEGVVDVQTDYNGTVATKYSAIDSYDSSVVEVVAVWYIIDTVAVVSSVGKVSVATDGVVAGCTEGVVHMQVYLYHAITACSQSDTVDKYRVADRSGWGVRNTMVVEDIATADSIILYVAEGIVNVQVNLDGAIATRSQNYAVDNDSVADKSCGRVSDAVVVVDIATADGVVLSVAERVVHRKVDVLYAIAALCRMQVLTVQSWQGVLDIVLCMDLSGTDNRIDGVAYGVRHSNIHHKCEVAVCRCLQQLTICASPCVCLVVYGNTTAGADGIVDSVAQGVAYYYIDYQIVEAHGIIITQMLGVLSCQRIRLVVGVEGGTRTDYASDGVADGVVHPDIHDHVAVAMVDRTVRINEGSSVPVLSSFEGKRLTCADGVVTLCAECVVHVQTNLDSAVATFHCMVDSKDGSVVEVVAVRYVIDTVAVVASVGKVCVATDGIVTDSAEGVVDVQTYLYSTVATFHGTINRKNGGIVEIVAVRYIADTVAVVASVGEVSIAANRVVADSAEGVVDM